MNLFQNLGRIDRDLCGCCDVCAKQKGEECGGPWGGNKCDDGLNCRLFDPNDYNKIAILGNPN